MYVYTYKVRDKPKIHETSLVSTLYASTPEFKNIANGNVLQGTLLICREGAKVQWLCFPFKYPSGQRQCGSLMMM